MPKVITAKEAEELHRKGEQPPAGSILTPSARDVFAGRVKLGGKIAAVPAKATGPIVPDYEFKWTPGSDPKTPADIERFFNSPAVQALKVKICDIGKRIWDKDYVDGNGGNITVRVGDNLVVCTPTLISKGFMTPADICLIDLDGKQLAGERKRTSEAMTHLGIMKRQPKAKACVHAHPPHATAFAVAGVRPPTCMIPEAEVFLGEIGYAKYQTPGTPENADEVGKIGVDHQAIIMENHGVIVWGKDVEDAYWKMENTDSYCKTVWIASHLGSGLQSFGGEKLKDLIRIRRSLGMPDNRADLRECELCDNSDFRPGVVCQVPAPAAPGTDASPKAEPADPAIEAAVKQIADQILKQLSAK
jgi:L-fuculose-phosphate aldolase